MICLNRLMLVESTILFGKQFHIFIEEGKNECKYALNVDDAWLQKSLIMASGDTRCSWCEIITGRNIYYRRCTILCSIAAFCSFLLCVSVAQLRSVNISLTLAKQE